MSEKSFVQQLKEENKKLNVNENENENENENVNENENENENEKFLKNKIVKDASIKELIEKPKQIKSPNWIDKRNSKKF